MSFKYYFESEQTDLTAAILSSPSLCHETLEDKEQVVFTRPSPHRSHCVIVARTFFWVNRKDIGRVSTVLNRKLDFMRHERDVEYNYCQFNDVSPVQMDLLLRAICPSNMGLYAQPVRADTLSLLLGLAMRFEIPFLLEECRQFLYELKFNAMPVGVLLNWFEFVTNLGIDDLLDEKSETTRRPIRSLILHSLLSSPDYSLAVSMVFLSKSANVPILKAIFRRKEKRELFHWPVFPNFFVGNGCNCSRNTSPSTCACSCNGHAKCETALSNVLDSPEVCGVCADNTTGEHCNVCADGFFGDPRNGGNCTPCECHGQADSCDPHSGHCYCRTKGVIGKYCDKCDAKYYGTPSNGTPCYYELTVDFIFTFKLKNEDKDKHATEIFLFSIPYKRDTDVTFQISCDSSALVAVHENSSHFIEHHARTRKLMTSTYCDHRGFRRVYSASDDGWAFGTDANTTFFVRVYNFTTPVVIQVSFAQSPPINWVLFFVIFAACFIVLLLVVAGLLWMVKLRLEVYRRNQRRIEEIEHMASRPFANVKLELTTHMAPSCVGPTPLSVEPCGNYKAGVFTLAVRLPTGGGNATPNGTSGLAVASALCQLTPAQLGVLQAPDNSDTKNGRKTNIRRYIPFLRGRDNENT